MKKTNKIIFLSIAVLVLAIFTVFYSSDINKNVYDVSIYIEGDNANLARVADLLVEYDKQDLELVSTSTGGFLDNSSVIKKDGWGINRALLMSTSADNTKPILKLRFKGKDRPKNIRLSNGSVLYLANIGAATLPSSGVSYRVEYGQ